MLVERLGREQEALPQHELIEVRKYGGVESHRVLHHQNHPHTHFEHIVLGVHLVLKQLDYRQQQVYVAKP